MNSAPVSRFVTLLSLLVLALLTGALLFPYLFQGRSLVPLEMVPLFQPWASHARDLWGTVPPVHNALLDSLQQYYPRRVYMSGALHDGWVPLWNSYAYGGTPFLATQQSAVLYPPAWVLALLPAELQFGWSAFFHLTLAAVGAFYFFRELGLRPTAAVAGGVAFAFNGFMVAWLAYPNVTQWTLCWLPLALFCGERALRRGDLRWSAAAGGVLALNLLGGHGQSSEYALLVWGAWMLTRAFTSGEGLSGAVRWVALPGVLAVGLALGHLLPSLDYLPRTDRGARIAWEAASGAGMPLSQLWTFLLPRLFGDETAAFLYRSWLPAGGKAGLAFIERTFYPGAAVLVLACAARVGAQGDRERRRLFWFSAALAGVGVLLAMGTPLYWPLWRLLPGFGQFTAISRVLCVDAWAFACLAALGMQALTEPDGDIRGRCFRPLMAGGLGLAAITGVGYFIYGGAAPSDITATLSARGSAGVESLATADLLKALACFVAPLLLTVLGRPRRGRTPPILSPLTVGGIMILVMAADLINFGHTFNPAAETRYLHAETPELRALAAEKEPFRFLSVGPSGEEYNLKKRLPSNLPSTLGLADLAGSDSFVPLRYREWESATQKASGGGSSWSRPGAPNLRGAGVRYYLGAGLRGDGLVPAAGPLLLKDARALPYARLHTNAQSLPRAQVLRNLEVANRAPTFAMVSGDGAPVFNGPPRVTPFKVERVNGNRLAVEGESPLPGLLVVCEGYDPGWQAWVDGKRAKLFPADHLLIGVPLEPGRHRVELVYAPQTFRVGAFGGFAALAVLCALLALPRGRREALDLKR